jgi:signal transduction histidine kinase
MKLTWRLSLAVSLGMLLVFAAHAAIRVHRDVHRFREHLQRSHEVLGLAVATAVEDMERVEGPVRARAIVERINHREQHVLLRWVEIPTEAADVGGTRATSARARPTEIRSGIGALADGSPALVSHIAVHTEGRPTTAIEIAEPLERESEYTREAMARTASSTALALALCIAIILLFGTFFVGRPLEALRDHARRIAAGDLASRTSVSSANEIGDLAREMNAMAAELQASRERLQAEEAARVETMAHLRHVDRLRAIGEMASAVAHDFGTPMGVIRARAQMIAGAEVPVERTRELAGAIVTEIDRMSESVRRLLGHARRGESIPPTTIELVAWTRDVVELLRPLATRRGVAIEVGATEPTHVTVDPTQLRHAVMNVVMNAVDASARSTSVRVEIAREASEVRVDVVDRGVGIAEEHLESVFEPFFTTKPEDRGTGLGLSIARAIVSEQGGTITAKSELGGGSTFTIRLKAASGPPRPVEGAA